jgi:WD40 repeat protein
MLRRFVLLFTMLLIITTTMVPLVSAQEPPLEPITLDNADQIEELVRFGNGVFTGSLAYSPDGATLAVAGSIGIWLYDTSDFEQAPRLIERSASVTRVAFSANGEYLLYRTTDGVYVTDFKSNDVVLTILDANDFAIHPDNQHLAVSFIENRHDFYSFYASMEIWDIDSKTRLQDVNAPPNEYGKARGLVSEMAFSGDGQTLAAVISGPIEDNCGQHNTYVFTWPFDGELGTSQILPMSDDLVFDRTKSILYTAEQEYGFGYSGRIRLWNTAQNQEVQLTDALIDRNTRFPSILDLRISDDGSQLAVIDQDQILLVNLESFVVIKTLEATEWQALHQLAFQPDGQQLVATTDHELWIWEGESQEATVIALEKSFRDVNFSPDGSGFVVNDDGELQLWSLNGLEAELTHSEKAGFRGFNGSKVIFQTENALHLWDFAERRELLTFDNLPEDSVKSFAWNTEGSLLAVITDKQMIEVWDLTTLEGRKQFETRQPAFKVQFSPNSEMLLAEARGARGQGTELYLWKFSGSEYPTTLGNNAPSITTVFSPDNQYLFTTQSFESSNTYGEGERSITYQWSLPAFRITDTFVGSSIGFLTDKNILYSSIGYHQIGGKRIFTFRNSDTLEAIGEIGYGGDTNEAANGHEFSPNGEYLITFTTSVSRCGGDYNAIKIWDVDTQKQLGQTATIRGPKVAFSPTASIFALTSYQEFAIWNLSTGEKITDIPAHSDYVRNIAFNYDGTMLMTSSADGTVRLWGVPVTSSD